MEHGMLLLSSVFNPCLIRGSFLPSSGAAMEVVHGLSLRSLRDRKHFLVLYPGCAARPGANSFETLRVHDLRLRPTRTKLRRHALESRLSRQFRLKPGLQRTQETTAARLCRVEPPFRTRPDLSPTGA